MGNCSMAEKQFLGIRGLYLILILGVAGLWGLSSALCRAEGAAGGEAASLAEVLEIQKSPSSLERSHVMEDTLDASGSVQGLTLHGAKVLELQYISASGHPPDMASGPLPGFTLNQRLEAEVEYLLPGIWVRGRFDDNPLFPQYMLRVDTANASVILGEVETQVLSPPLSPASLPLTGVQGTVTWRDLTLSLAAGHPQTVLKTETFLLHPTVRVYQTANAPLVPGTEILQLEGRRLTAGVDYLIDYNTGAIRLLSLWPEAARLTASYQVTDATPGRKPLIQGFRTEYALKAGTLGFTHLSRREIDPDSPDHSSWPDFTPAPYAASQTWSALSYEAAHQGPGIHWAAEVWHRASQPSGARERTVDDMETHLLRRPLFAQLSNAQSWSEPRGTSGSSLELRQVSGWLPMEGITRSALQLDFVLEGTGAWTAAQLTVQSALKLQPESDLLLTLGLPQPLPGIKLEVRLLSGAAGFFRQAVPLGNLAGWQDVLLMGSQWEKDGLPAWDKITGVELRLVSLLPGDSYGQLIFCALDAGTASRASSRWRPLTPQGTMIEVEDVPLPHAPWSPPPGNTALAVRVKGSGIGPSRPQVLGHLPRSFFPADAEHLTFWVQGPSAGIQLAIWLLDEEGNTAAPVSLELSPGWAKYRLDLSGPAAQLRGREAAAIALALTPPPGADSAAVILDEWQLEGAPSVEGYMGRFALSQDSGTIRWRLTGSSQTKGFQWDLPGITDAVPHPHHLGLDAEIQRPGNQRTAVSIQQLGTGDGETNLALRTDTWEGTVLEGRLSIPNSGSISASAGKAPTGHLRLETQLLAGSLAVTAWQKTQPAFISDPLPDSTQRGLSLQAERLLPSGVLKAGAWQLLEGPSGQTVSGDLDWQLAGTLPITTGFWLLRYQRQPGEPAETGALGRLETSYESPGGTWQVRARWEEEMGRESQDSLGLDRYQLDAPLSGSLHPETGLFVGTGSPRLWRQSKALGWQWRLAEETALEGRWQQEAAENLDSHQGSLTDSGSLALSWPLSSRWQSRGAVGWSSSQEAAGSLSSVEYSLAGEGSWLEQWTARVILSQRQTQMQPAGPSSGDHSPNRGHRWLLKGDAQYAYRPQGSIGLGMALAHQAGITGGMSGLGGHYSEGSPPGSLYSWESETYSPGSDIGDLSMRSCGEFQVLPASGETAGTYLDGRVRWTLADGAIYRLDLGTLAFLPLTSSAASMTPYARAAWEKNWGALGTSSFHAAAGAGSQSVWSVGLVWARPAALGETGLFWQASIRHVKQADYHFTSTSLGLEYRF
jgi:hypothetical protein